MSPIVLARTVRRLIVIAMGSIYGLLGSSLAPLAAQTPDNPLTLSGHLGAITSATFASDNRYVITGSGDHSARWWQLDGATSLRSFEQHTGPIYALAASADGRLLVTAGQDNVSRVWQLPPVKPTHRFPAEASSNTPGTSIATSLNGGWLAWGSTDGHVHFFDPTATVAVGNAPGAPPVDIAIQPTSRQLDQRPIRSVAVRPDGVWIAAANNEGEVLVWSPFVETLQARFLAHASPVIALFFRNDNQSLVTVAENGEWSQWKFSLRPAPTPPTETPTESADEPPVVDPNLGESPSIVTLVRSGRFEIAPLRQATMIGNSSRLAVIGSAATVAMVDVDAPLVDGVLPDSAQQSIDLAGATPIALASRQDGQRLAVGTASKTLLLLRTDDFTVTQSIELAEEVHSLAFAFDNGRLASIDVANQLTIFAPPQPAREGVELAVDQTGPVGDAKVLAAGIDNLSYWTTTASGQVERWPVVSPRPLFQLNHGGPVYSVVITKDGSKIVSCSTDQSVRIFDGTNGQQRFQLTGHQGAVHALAMAPDESFVVSSGADGTLRMWDIVGGRALRQIAKLDETQYAIAIHPDGNRLASCGADRLVHLFDLASGNELRSLPGHTDYVHAISFDPTGRRLASYGYAGELKIWSTDDGALLWETQVATVGNALAYSADGTRLLLGSGDGYARVVEVPVSAR